MFTLTIQTDNAAFREDEGTESGDALRAEVARILRRAAKELDTGADDGKLQDVNGNTVGSFELTA